MDCLLHLTKNVCYEQLLILCMLIIFIYLQIMMWYLTHVMPHRLRTICRTSQGISNSDLGSSTYPITIPVNGVHLEVACIPETTVAPFRLSSATFLCNHSFRLR